MRIVLASVLMASMALPTLAQQSTSASDYRVCAADQTELGRDAVRQSCGDLRPPAFPSTPLASYSDVEEWRAARDTFTLEVTTYASCVTEFIDSYRKGGASATSLAPDQAACAHAWAEEQATEAVRAYGRACIDFSNRSMMDAALTPWSGACYPAVPGDNG
jgi:hypothetical protein